MSSRSARKRHSTAPRKKPEAAAAVRQAVPVDSAANDETTTSSFTVFGDPLLGMAIATGILFAALAALIAFS
jgi:hypothetical protein